MYVKENRCIGKISPSPVSCVWVILQGKGAPILHLFF